jgi:hypothetical protein
MKVAAGVIDAGVRLWSRPSQQALRCGTARLALERIAPFRTFALIATCHCAAPAHRGASLPRRGGPGVPLRVHVPGRAGRRGRSGLERWRRAHRQPSGRQRVKAPTFLPVREAGAGNSPFTPASSSPRSIATRPRAVAPASMGAVSRGRVSSDAKVLIETTRGHICGNGEPVPVRCYSVWIDTVLPV